MAASTKKPAPPRRAQGKAQGAKAGNKAAGSKAAAAASGEARNASAKAVRSEDRGPDSPCLSLAQERALAKNAMWASLAVLTVTAYTGAHKKGLSRSLHLASGAALIGLSLWHHSLYSGKKADKCPAPTL